MNPHEPSAGVSGEALDAAPPASVPEVGPTPTDPSPDRLWVTLGGAGLVAGVLVALIGEWTHRAVVPPFVTTYPMGVRVDIVPRPEEVSAGIKNSMLTFGVMGAILGGLLGVAGGLARRSTRSALIAGAIGLVLAGAAGALTSWGLVPKFYTYEDQVQEQIGSAVVVPMLIHMGIWGSLGGLSGLAAGIGLGGRDRIVIAILGGLVGALVGTGIYELVGVYAFPMEMSTRPLSGSMTTRILARGLVCVLTAVGVVLALTAESRPRPAAASSGSGAPPAAAS
jgi:uncharacterized membrane protein required for colicin V production